MITPKSPEVDLGIITLSPTSQAVEGVTITGRKEMMTHSLDKKVVNVEKDLANIGGSALDVMQNVPSVTVDFDGNVSLRGSSNVNILIDGKPSQMTSLDQLPAAMIESVEVVTNPSVKYDPDGMAGIINIVLKKQKITGTNGMVSLNAGTNNRYMGSVNLNFKKDAWNFFTNIDYRHFTMSGYSNSTSKNDFGSVAKLDQVGDFDRKMDFGGARFGVDYTFGSKNTLSFTSWFNGRIVAGDDLLKSTSYDGLNQVSNYYQQKRHSTSKDGIESDITLSYRKEFETKGRNLTVDLFVSTGDEISNSDQTKDFYNNIYTLPALEKTETLSPGLSYTLQSDYVTPIGNGGRLETGVKADIKNPTNDYSIWNYNYTTNIWDLDTQYSNDFDYKLQVYSAYASYSNTLGKLAYTTGIRVEESHSESKQKTTDQNYKKNLISYFPSLHLKYTIVENHDLSLSYSRRINRPRSRVLNPFTIKQDQENISYGNPTINPEYVNSYEIGYGFQKNKTNVTTTFFYRQTDDVIAQQVSLNNGIYETTYDNLNKSVNYGFETVASSPLFKWWRVNASYSYFHAEIDGAGVTSDAKSSNSWTTKASSSITLPFKIEFQQSFNYRSPIVTSGTGGHGFSAGGQGKMKEMWSMDMGLKKDIMKGKGSLSLRISDIFKTTTYYSTTYGTNFERSYERGRDSQMIFVGFTYKINDYRRSSKKQSDTNDNTMDDFQ
ncbi:outer membrane beta-barrel family protein [Williamwhitmania taraxaci]|uniref:Outer membrane receptor proteins, mostly Fe transport n=1 Tax=Williamwhitmania taraxaci TaxID=1640674 RepID=A0A1G6HGN1_9BACT|nr:outer membrane beta-barrel family protein [Williamwhitmania taraxaci]SDB93409.1 Outer membrane receptor proteins, mostly Fe transport [Williamwhitmania taraxaci]